MTVLNAREQAAAARLTRFRGDMNDEDFALLVKDVVRVLYKVYVNNFDELALARILPPLKVAIELR